jgi:hypothetical protein
MVLVSDDTKKSSQDEPRQPQNEIVEIEEYILEDFVGKVDVCVLHPCTDIYTVKIFRRKSLRN